MEYNPLLPEVQENPYPYYAYLRQHAPVYWVASLECWALSRYADVDYAVRTPQLFSSAGFIATIFGDMNPVPEVPWMLDLDPPDHTRLRKLVNKAFTPRLVSAMEPRLRSITDQLLAAFRNQPVFDLVKDFSMPLPVTVIAELLGIEQDRRIDFKRWSDDVGHSANRPSDVAEQARIRHSVTEMRAYLQGMISQRRTDPQDDLITALIRAEEEHQVLSSNEIFALTALLLLAGNETTTNLIGNAVLLLLDYPEVLAQIRDQPALLPQFIEEVLRFESPIQCLFRQATGDIDIAGATIPAGARVLLLNGSANRDEGHFLNADQFALERNSSDHLAFGYGIHYCLGAQLARLEARVALEALLFDLPPFSRQTQTVERIRVLNLRGPHTLPLVWAA
jgi:cytochrome P450